MALKDNLQHIFNGDYPGIDVFVNNVIIPIMGNDIDYKNIDLAARTEYVEKATKAGIKRLVYVADITEQNYSSQNIALFDVTLDNSVNVERARVNIQQLIRSVVGYYNHILIVFHYEDPTGKAWRFSYAHKIDSQANTTSAKRYTYVFGRDFRARTAADRFVVLAKSNRTDKDFEEAFSVQALSDEFFDLYRAYYAAFVEFITGEKYTDEKKLNAIISRWNWLQKDDSDQFSTTFDNDAKDVRDYIKKMFGRIVFLYFLQRKGWLYDANGNSDARYMRHLFDGAGELKDTFLDDVLELLFFYVLNTKSEQRVQDASLAHKDITILPGWDKIPFLNGGLFSQDDIDPKKCVFPAVYFDELFRFLDSYNFTIDENDQEDAEVGIDPEMLGRIFENLLEDNKDKGAFYTPKEIVDYMCRESIIAYLQDDRFTESGNELIRQFIETLNIDLLDTKQRDYIEDRLLKVKICDPAIGSGAFPMGLVNLLSKIFIVLRTYKTIDQAKMKRYIMQQSIYGVDIEQGAVDIARLRFWLAMVVDENEPQPLPNLHFKIMQGNSLVESYKGLDLSTLMKPEPGRLDYITDEGRKQLRSSLAYFFNESDHEKRNKRLVEIKNTVSHMVYNADSNINMTELDSSANDQFFMWHTWFADVFEKGGFDIVIGNPPYGVSVKGEYRTTVVNSLGKVPDFEIYYFFIRLAQRLLNQGGVLSYIIPNTFLFNNFAKNFRNELIANWDILEILDCTKFSIFQSAVVRNAIILWKRERPKSTIGYRKTAGIDSFKDLVSTNRLKMSIPDLLKMNQNWGLAFSLEDSVVRVVNSISSKTDTISSFFDISQGYIPYRQSDLIKQYGLIEGKNICKNRLWHSSSKMDDDYIQELNGRDITKFSYNIKGEFVKYGKHLACYVDLKYFSKERIVVREITNPSIIACKIEENVICVHDPQLIAIITKDEMFSLNVLWAILNSKLATFYHFNHSPKATKGAFPKILVQDIKDFPLPTIEQSMMEVLESKVSNLIKAKKLDSTDDTSPLESEIDHIVYHLYELTYDEVLIVDPETPITCEQYENFKLQ